MRYSRVSTTSAFSSARTASPRAMMRGSSKRLPPSCTARRAGRERVGDRDGVRSGVIARDDRGGASRGDRRRVRAHGGHRLPGVADLRLEQLSAGELDPRNVPVRDRGAHAGDLQRRSEIEPHEQAVRDRCTHDGGVQHPGAADVHRVARAAGDLRERVHARHAAARDAQGHSFLPRRGLERRQLDDLRLDAPFHLNSGGDEARRAGSGLLLTCHARPASSSPPPSPRARSSGTRRSGRDCRSSSA